MCVCHLISSGKSDAIIHSKGIKTIKMVGTHYTTIAIIPEQQQQQHNNILRRLFFKAKWNERQNIQEIDKLYLLRQFTGAYQSFCLVYDV